jgi:hydroxymethylglutaryl-CoA lyase/(R)-citramalyl-CoA lyase
VIAICDVGPRDGLQNDPIVLAPAVRADLVERLARTGVGTIEAASFVHPKLVPQMAGAEDVIAAVAEDTHAALAGLVLNPRGYDRLRTTRLREVHLSFAASETFNQRNQNATTEASLLACIGILERAAADGIRANVTIATSFGCPFEGRVDPGRVVEIARRLVDAGCEEILLGDTIGVAVPPQVRELVTHIGAFARVGVHLHNTRNTGYANAFAAAEAGARAFDASIGGIGGCPFAPNATGNIATEDLVYLFESSGLDTGIDLDAAIDVARWLSGVLGRPLDGALHRAGGFATAGR